MHPSFEHQFEWAAAVFHDPRALSFFDGEHSSSEDRWITLGLDQGGVPVIVCHTFEQEEGQHKARVRIISARRATRREIQQYREV